MNRTTANPMFIQALTVGMVFLGILSLVGCDKRSQQEIEKAVEKAKEEAAQKAKEAAKKALDDAVKAAKDKVKKELDKIGKETCPRCNERTDLVSEGNRHKWWLCPSPKCKLEFATYSGNHPTHKDTYKGYCTWYANDRWLYDGDRYGENRSVLHGDAKDWYDSAPENMKSKSPSPGSIAVFGASKTNRAGHVAYVESVDNTTYTIWQMNAGAGAKFVEGLKTNYFDRVSKDTLQSNSTATKYGPLMGFIRPSKSSELAVQRN